MWSIFFTVTFSGALASILTELNEAWLIMFYILMFVCIVTQVTVENKQEERIKKLEKRLEEMVGEDNA